jgi:predicted MPP superfamily phosphohydrolase
MAWATRAAATALLGVLGLAAGSIAWGVVVEPRLIDRRDEVGWVPGLPPEWEGKRLALLADPQVGLRLANIDAVRRAIRLVVRERPALALIAGDFVYNAARHPRRAVAQAVELVRPLVSAGVPTYAVLGNHDYAEEAGGKVSGVAAMVCQALGQVGVRVLHNAAVDLGGLYLVGIGPYRVGEDRSGEAFAAASLPAAAPRVVLMHNPRSFAGLPSGWAPLALAGHTHGGQIRMPLRPDWNLARLVKPWPRYMDGWIDGYGKAGNRLYVNRGLGFSMIPVRIGCPPEVTFFTLRRGL